jgi:hypothetical protein
MCLWPGSMAHRLRPSTRMSEQRRCVIWVNTTTFQAAQELADLAGVDVDTFVANVVNELHEQVNELHEQEMRDGAMRARAGGGRGAAEVIPMEGEQRRRRSRSRG